MARAPSASTTRPESGALPILGGSYGFWRGFILASLVWCALSSLYLTVMFKHASSSPSDDLVKMGLRSSRALHEQSTAAASATPSPSPLVSPSSAPPPPLPAEASGGLQDERAEPPVTGTWKRGQRSAYAQRYTDMTCYTHGDESELCAYENAICYDGDRLVLSVPEPPTAEIGSNQYGHIMGELTTNCYDFRYYEAEAVEYNGCRYDSPRFHRIASKLIPEDLLNAPPVPVRDMPGRWGNGFDPDDEIEAIFMARDVKTDWPIPLTRRRWGPGNRGSLTLREINGEELFGPLPGQAPRPCEGCQPPRPPGFSPELKVSHVTQFGNTTATWLDGPLWIMAVDAQVRPWERVECLCEVRA
jgi:hypothetical protein